MQIQTAFDNHHSHLISGKGDAVPFCHTNSDNKEKMSQTASSVTYPFTATRYEVKTCQLGLFKFSSAGGEALQLNAIFGRTQVSLISSVCVRGAYCSSKATK